jgi:hypothetical protein
LAENAPRRCAAVRVIPITPPCSADRAAGDPDHAAVLGSARGGAGDGDGDAPLG